LAISLLLGLWMESDDSGTFEWKPLTLKARILPAIGSDIELLFSALEKSNLIKLFEIESRPYGVVRNFVRFQRPKKPMYLHPHTSESRAYAGFKVDGTPPPAPTGRHPSNAGGTGSEPVRNSFRSGSGFSPQMEEGGGRRERKKERSLRDPKKKNLILIEGGGPEPGRPTRVPEDFQPTVADRKWARGKLGPDAAKVQFDKFMDYWRSKPGAAGWKADWNAAWRYWVHDKIERGETSNSKSVYTGEI
jgi:hypothetical protein